MPAATQRPHPTPDAAATGGSGAAMAAGSPRCNRPDDETRGIVETESYHAGLLLEGWPDRPGLTSRHTLGPDPHPMPGGGDGGSGGRSGDDDHGGGGDGGDDRDDDEAPWYILMRHLGHGGMGDVLLARDRIARQVALKVIRPALADDPEFVEGLRREASTMGRIQSPRIARVHTFFGPGQLPRHAVAVTGALEPTWIDRVHRSAVLVMEFVRGRTLRDLLNDGPIRMSKALRVGCRLARALHELHRNQPPVEHRDLKPENIMLSGDRQRLKLLDMGLARVRWNSGRSVEDDGGQLLGLTPRYAAPEQFLLQPVGRAADLWAFGCVLFECLVGQPPFRAAGLGPLRDAVLLFDPPLDELPSGTPQRVRRLIARCLSKLPEERPEAAEAYHLLRPWAVRRGRAHNNLPASARVDPIGRETLVPLVARELRAHRSGVVCLHGLPGSGKRRVAHAAALRLANLRDSQRPWIVCRVNLDPLPRGADGAAIAGRALASLRTMPSVGERVPRDVAAHEAMATLGGVLGRKPALLILEGIQRAEEGFVAFVESLRELAPETTILATGLEPPPLFDIALVPVPPLTVPQPGDDLATIARCGAVRLFLDVARSTRGASTMAVTASNSATIGRICRAVGGLPLAIRLVAPHVDTLSLEEIERRLSDLLRMPADPTGGSSSQLSMEAALALAVEDLEVAERTLLARLSIFHHGFSLRAAEFVCDDGAISGSRGPTASMQAATVHGTPLLLALRGLVRRQLVLRSGDRFRHIEPVRQFATSLLAVREPVDAIRSRFVEWFGEVVDRGQPERLPEDPRATADWFREIEADQDNIRETLRLLAQSADGAATLASHIRALEHFWFAAGPVHDAWTWCERALARIGELGDPLQRVRLLAASGATAARSRRFDDADRCYRQAIAEAQAAALALPLAALTSNLGLLMFMRGRLSECEALAREASALYAAAGHPGRDTMDRLNIAAVRKHSGDLATSESLLRDLLHRLGPSHQGPARWLSEQNLGELEVARGEHDAALVRFRRAWRGHRRINRLEQVRAILWMGIAHCLAGRQAAGRRRIRAAEPLYQSLRSLTHPWIDTWLKRALRT